MKTITKAQLAAENAALRTQLGDVMHDLSITREALRVERGGKEIPHFLRRTLPEHMQRAKDMAMSAGITVKVGHEEHNYVEFPRGEFPNWRGA